MTGAVVGLVALAARSVDWTTTWRTVRQASPLLLATAALVNVASLATRGVRWWLFLRPAGARSLAVAVRGAIVGSGLNNVLAANGGEAARVLLVARHAGVSSAPVLAALALDRLVEMLSCVMLLVAAPLVVPLPAVLSQWRFHAAAVLAVLLTVCLLLLRRATHGRALAVAAAAAPTLVGPVDLPAPERPRWGARARAFARHFGGTVGALLTPRRLAGALALSLVSWFGQAVTYHLTARALGFPASLAASTAAMLAVNLAFVIQLTPGNVGIFQLMYALVMVAFGLAHDPAVGVAVLIQVLQIVPVTGLALLLAPELALRRPAAARQ